MRCRNFHHREWEVLIWKVDGTEIKVSSSWNGNRRKWERNWCTEIGANWNEKKHRNPTDRQPLSTFIKQQLCRFTVVVVVVVVECTD